jgi:hypothetical protein
LRGFLLASLGICAVLSAQPATQKPAANPLQRFEFLLGKWSAIGGGQPGAGAGEFSFDAELDRHIVVRHNYAQYNQGAEAGTRHDDLLIVYLEASGPRAIYFDSEGHVIRYRVNSPMADSVVFESDGSEPGPRYRLSYILKGAQLEGNFEIANSSADPYKSYLRWTAKRKL